MSSPHTKFAQVLDVSQVFKLLLVAYFVSQSEPKKYIVLFTVNLSSQFEAHFWAQMRRYSFLVSYIHVLIIQTNGPWYRMRC